MFHDQSPRKNVADPAGVESATSWSPVGRTSNWATEADQSILMGIDTLSRGRGYYCQNCFVSLLKLTHSKRKKRCFRRFLPIRVDPFSQVILWKHAYSNIQKILPPKNEPPQRGGSNEYLQSMFLSRKKKNNVYPCKPQFYYIKVGFKGGVKTIMACFLEA